jgi:hypothetical protein
VALTTRALPALFHDRFGGPPERAVTVFILPTNDAFSSFCTRRYGHPCPSDYGKYDEDKREVVVNVAPGGPTTLLHELVHGIMQSDAPHAPDWFSEAMATWVEVPDLHVDGEIHAGPNKRRGVVIEEAARAKPRVPLDLDHLFSLPTAELRRDEHIAALYYAVGFTFCAWLDAQNQLWPLYHLWRDSADRDPTGRWSFQKVVGKTPAQATPDWMAWVKAPATR